MPHSFGYRARTRDLYSKKKGGMPKPTGQLKVFKIGDYVDVLCDPAIHGGMPYKYYYGKTGRVWNVTKRALGIEMLKTVGNRKRTKRFHIRVEHLRHSDSRKKFLARVRTNDAQKREYRANKDETKFVALKRQPEGPKGGYVLKKRACTKMYPMW